MSADQPRYRFGPLEQRGLIAGWRSGQVGSVAGGLVVGVVTLHARPGPLGVVLAVIAVMGSVALACWPLGGRTAEQWLPTLTRWVVSGGTRLHRSAAPTVGSLAGPERGVDVSRPVIGSSVAFRGLSIERSMSESDEVGFLHDARADTHTCVLAVAGHGFALLGSDEQLRRVSGWAAALASFAHEGSTVRRIQWLASTTPDQGRTVRAHFGRQAAVDEDDPVARSYRDLLGESVTVTRTRDVHLALQVSRTGAARSAREGRDGARAALLRETQAFRRRLHNADLEVGSPLSPRELGHLCARLVSPYRELTDTGAPRPDSIGHPWPLAVRAEWGAVQTDALWHCVYWIAEWPRLDVAPDFLAPLLLGTVRRTISVVMEPLSPRRAARAVEQARVADLADAELRRRGGFLSSARRSRESELVVQRESELADGHVSVRFSGYVIVTAASCEELADACEQTEHAGAQAYLELRRLYGDQQRAIAYALPLCRGLS